MGAMPGVTRQVSAFRIASNPPLYLVDTPGVMVPRVERATEGLRLALVRAVPDSVVPPDVTLGFMLRVVRLRRLFGSRSSRAAGPRARPVRRRKEEQEDHEQNIEDQEDQADQADRADQGDQEDQEEHVSSAARGRGGEKEAPRVSRAVEAWLSGASASSGAAAPVELRHAVSDSDDAGAYERDAKLREDDMETLLAAVQRESGAEGKKDAECRRMCCRYLLDAFREGQFGRITLDGVPRVRQKTNSKNVPDWSPSEGGWARGLKRRGELRGGEEGGVGASAVGVRRDLGALVDRDWSSESAWERAEAGRT